MATADVELKRGDQRPYLDATLSDANGAIDLTGATVGFFMQDQTGVTIIDTQSTDYVVVQSATAGTVRYKWSTGDTDEEGNFRAEWRAFLAGATSEQISVPNGDWISVAIRATS